MMSQKITIFFALLIVFACSNKSNESNISVKSSLDLNVLSFIESEGKLIQKESSIVLQDEAWVSYNLKIEKTARYRVKLIAESDSAIFWIEDYIDNKDGRTYNITGNMIVNNSISESIIDGSPMQKGEHKIKIHFSGSKADLKTVKFEILKEHKETKTSLTQNMTGSDLKLVWSDEFNGEGLPDTTKWSYNIGDWGWGNNELQYYTEGNLNNARQENGSLIIESHYDSVSQNWTSARLTTQEKVSFLYGRIDFRAKVPVARGTWAAGWFLGDAYRDEISWPYCGEIDVLECVGFEINDTTGAGLNHATCHTPAYYFKIGNQIGSAIEVDSMNTKFHDYSIIWYPDSIQAYLDGEYYYTYDKNANRMEWPFDSPQNIIVNLAVGGGWGGAKGIDSSYNSHQYILDYIRVYELTN